MNTAFLFPGQGTQRVGMGRGFFERHDVARAVFDRASALLDLDIARVCFRGPPDELDSTALAQPALFVVSAAAMAVLEDAGRPASCTAGHSVGEIAALYAAGVFDFDTAVRVVRRRGELMSTAQPGVMAAVIGLDEPTITAVCDTARAWGRVCIGLQNGASNFVISGDDAAIEVAAARCRDRGALKVTRLRTGFAFHSPIMDPVVRPWRDYVATIPLRRPTIPVALNSTGAIATDTDVVRHALVDQIARPVRWHNCLRSLVDVGARSFVEVGDSKVLSAQVRELDRTLAVGTMADPRVERRLFSTRTWESHGAVS